MKCPHCGEIVWTPQQAYEHQLKRLGLCNGCKQPNPAGGWYCATCGPIRAAKARARRAGQRERQAVKGAA